MKKMILMMVVLSLSGLASATYVPATPANTGPASAITTDSGQWANGSDNLWAVCNVWWDVGLGLGSFSAIGEPAPTITTTVDGLEAGTYEVYLMFNGYDGASIQAGISGASLEVCTFSNSTNTGYVPFGGFALLEHYLGTVSGTSFSIDIAPHGPESYYAGLSYVAVPETLTMVLLSLGGLLLRRRKA